MKTVFIAPLIHPPTPISLPKSAMQLEQTEGGSIFCYIGPIRYVGYVYAHTMCDKILHFNVPYSNCAAPAKS